MVATLPRVTLNEQFRRFAARVSDATGRPWAFMLALLTVLVWALSGPYYGFSDTWQIVINTGTTVVTFLMVFLLQATQSREAQALHLKLDELIRAKKTARNQLASVEHASDAELAELRQEFRKLRNDTRPVLQDGQEEDDPLEKIDSDG